MKSKVIISVFIALVLLSGCDKIEYRPDLPAKEKLVKLDNFKAALLWEKSINTARNSKNGRLLEDLNLNFIPDGNALIAVNNNGIVKLDISNGAILQQSTSKLNITGGPFLGQDKLYVTTFAPQPKIIAFDKNTLLESWEAELDTESFGGIATDANSVILNTTDGGLVALNQEGHMQWNYKVTINNLAFNKHATPIIIDDKVIAGFSNGKIIAFNKFDGNLIWGNEINLIKGRHEIQQAMDIIANFNVKNNILYAVGSQGKLKAINLDNGELIWESNLASSVDFINHNNILLLATDKGHLVALDNKNGAAIWKQEILKGRMLTAPVLIGKNIFIGDEDGWVHVFNFSDGSVQGRLMLNSGIIKLVAHNTQIFALCKNGKISALKV